MVPRRTLIYSATSAFSAVKLLFFNLKHYGIPACAFTYRAICSVVANQTPGFALM